jgi:hypothetical protein
MESTLNVHRRVSGRRVSHFALITLELLVAAGAVFGGIGLIADNAIGMLPEWLEGTGFASWTLPGVLLLLVVAVPMSGAAFAEIRRLPWAYALSMLAGAAQLGWIVAQWLIMQKFFFLQPVMLAAGAGVLILAFLAHRGESLVESWHA